MKEYIVKSESETRKIAVDLAKKLKGGELLAFSGNLGVGKTFFIKALAKELGIKEKITSPTFVLMKVYELDYKKAKKFVHADCYRLSGYKDLMDIGLGDYLNYETIIVALEWANKVTNLPKHAIKIHMELLDEKTRKITIS